MLIKKNANIVKGYIKKLTQTGFIHIFGSGLINKVLTFLSGIILVRLVPKQEYGAYAYAQNIFNFIMIASGLGLSSGVFQICCERRKDRADYYFNKGLLWGIKINCILAMLIFITAQYVPLPVADANGLLKIMAFLPIITLIFEMSLVYYRYNVQNQEYSYLTTINTALILIFSVIGAFVGKARGMIFFQYIGYFLTILYAIMCLKLPFKNFFLKSVQKLEDWNAVIKISLISMINNAASIILYNLDIFTLGIMISHQEVIASYKIATYIPNALSFIPSSLIIYIYPFFVEHAKDKEWIKHHYKSLLTIFGLFNFGVSTLLIIMAPFIIRVVFGEQYLDSISVFRILSLGYFFNATFRNTAGNLLVTQRKLNINFWIGLLSGVVNVLGNVILIKIYGPIGAALTTLIVMVISGLVSVGYFYKVINKIK